MGAFDECRSLADVYSYITYLSKVSYGTYPFICMVEAYQADGNWYPYFGQIVEVEPGTDLPGDVNGDGEANIYIIVMILFTFFFLTG